jgi:hypothetical protein
MSHMSSSSSARGRCPECGAELAAGQARCWLCERKVSEAESSNPYASPRPTDENLGLQFSLASLLLITTLAAVCLGLFLLSPGLGILLGVFAIPALVRTFIDVSQYKRGGVRLGILDKLASFVLSLLVVGAVALAAGVAFLSVCMVGASVAEASRFPDWLGPVLVVSSLAGLVAAGLLFWVTRPRG